MSELEARIALLEQEARRDKHAHRPTETVRIGKHVQQQREDEEPSAAQPVAVLRLHEDAPVARRVGPMTEPLVLPTAPAGVATRLDVAPLPEQLAPAEDPVARYREALGLIKAQQFEHALALLASITRDHPQHPLASQAAYWKGEAHYAARRYREALIEFEALLTRFPSSPRVPDALLKAGLCNRRLGQEALAHQYFERVRKEHPKSNAAQSASREGSS